MTSFSSKYNKNLTQQRDSSHSKRAPVIQKKEPVRKEKSSVKSNLDYSKSKSGPTQQSNTPLSYKEIVNNVENIKTITLNELNGQNIISPETYKYKPINKINDSSQLLILKEIKWGESC
jgi:hypothetical protein